MGLQQVIQQRSPGAFFKRQMQASAQPMHELENRNRLGLDDAFHHQLARAIQYRDRDRVLVNIHSDILRAFHRSVLLSDGEIATAHSLVQGRTFLYCVGFAASSGSRTRESASRLPTTSFYASRPPR